jgi:hypothetical protein
MKTIAALIALNIACQAAAMPDQSSGRGPVYIVTRATGAESRALLSARLVKLNAANLHWYDGANVVRADVPEEALQAVRADRDVVLALSEQSSGTRVIDISAPVLSGSILEPAPPTQFASQMQPAACAAPAPMMGNQFASMPQMAQMGMQQMGMGMPQMGMGMPQMSGGMGMGMGLMDSLAGGVAAKLLNRAPSCKVSVAKNASRFAPMGGDGVIEVEASGSCVWQAQASVPWIKIGSGSGVSGSGVVSYTVAPSDGKPRSGSISIVLANGGSPIKGKASLVVTQVR